MSQFMSTRSIAARAAAAAMVLLSGGCRGESPTQQQPQPLPDPGIAGVSNANSTVCARDGAGTTWCTRADATGAFWITRADAAPGTATGNLPRQGQFTVYNVDCLGVAKTVDRSGPQPNGGAWLDVRCTPDGCVAPPTGLLAWYRFDEIGGDTVADFGNAAPSAALGLHGQAAHVPGRVLGGLQLSYNDGYAQGSAATNLGTGDFSIAVWLRGDPAPGWAFSTLLDKRDNDGSALRGYHMVVDDYEPLIQLADGGAYGGWYNYHAGFRVAPDGEWHFLVVTVQRASDTGLRWYYDGVPAGDVADPTARQGSLSSTSPLLVGRHSFYGSGFSGAVDELQIVNRVLSPAEIATLYTRHSCR
jgi:hypothetical protein